MELNVEFHIKCLFIPGERDEIRTTCRAEARVVLDVATETLIEALRELELCCRYYPVALLHELYGHVVSVAIISTIILHHAILNINYE
jgi:hypothetical protein